MNEKEKVTHHITEEYIVLIESLHIVSNIYRLVQWHKYKWIAHDQGN